MLPPERIHERQQRFPRQRQPVQVARQQQHAALAEQSQQQAQQAARSQQPEAVQGAEGALGQVAHGRQGEAQRRAGQRKGHL